MIILIELLSNFYFQENSRIVECRFVKDLLREVRMQTLF